MKISPIIIALMAFMSVSAQRKDCQPRNLQGQVVNIIDSSKHMKLCETVLMGTDTIMYVRYIGKKKEIKAIRVGTWFTVHADWRDKPEMWHRRRITINR